MNRHAFVLPLLFVLAILNPLGLQLLGRYFPDKRSEQFEERVAKVEKLTGSLAVKDDLAFNFVEMALSDTMWANEKGIITAATPSAAAMFGYKVDEVKNKPIVNLMPENLRPKHLAGFNSKMIASTADPRDVFPSKCQGLKKDGSTFPIEVRVRVADLQQGSKTVRVALARFIPQENIVEPVK